MALNLSAGTENTMAEFKTFENIPIPEGRATRVSKYPWDDLPKGGSFFVPGAKSDTFNTLVSTRNKREKDAKGDKGKKYVSRKFNHEGVDGIMVWRTA